MNKINRTFYVSHFWGFFVSINSTAFVLSMINVDIMQLYAGHVLAFILICIGFGLKCFIDSCFNHSKLVEDYSFIESYETSAKKKDK